MCNKGRKTYGNDDKLKNHQNTNGILENTKLRNKKDYADAKVDYAEGSHKGQESSQRAKVDTLERLVELKNVRKSWSIKGKRKISII